MSSESRPRPVPPEEVGPVGRERELAALGRALDAVFAGRGSLWLVSGEPGIGKSRLLEVAADEAAGRGAAVHWGHCWEAGGAPAYWPWIQVLRSLARKGRGPEGTPPPVADWLRQRLPEPGPGDHPSPASTADLLPDEARFALMDGVVEHLLTAAETVPTVILLEDLHAADPSSVTLLGFVARRMRTARVLVVGSFRDVGVRGTPSSRELAALARDASLLRLAPLADHEVAAIVRRICRVAPGQAALAEVVRASEGNPLYAVELAGLMVASQACDGRAAGDGVGLPSTLEAVIGERVSRLGPAAHELLRAASVLGRDFRCADLEVLEALRRPEVTEALERAVAAGVVERRGTGAFRFAHFLDREVLLAELGAERRAELHRRWAEELRLRQAGDGEPRWSELAHHLLEAGPEAAGEALEASLCAARQAAAQLAFDEAAQLYGRALDLLEARVSVEPELRSRVLVERARARFAAGALAAGREDCSRAAEIAAHLDDAELLASAALAYGSVFVYADVDAALVALLERALGALGEHHPGLRARLEARLAAALQPARDPSGPMAMAREAIAAARRTGDPEVLLDCIRDGCSALMDLAPPEERLALNREHVALADRLGRSFDAFRGHLRLATDALELGDLATADAAAEACEGLAARSRLPHHRWPVAAFRALRATMSGRFRDAELHLASAQEAADRAGDPNAVRTLWCQRLALARAREDLEALRQLRQRRPTATHDTSFTALFLRVQEACSAARLRPDEVSRGAETTVVDRALILGDRALLAPLAEIEAAAERPAAAADLFERLEPYADHCVQWGLFGMAWDGPVARVLALLAARLGRNEEAARLFESAAAIAARAAALPMLARIRYEQARHLAHTGLGSAAGLDPLGEARRLADDLGLGGLQVLIENLAEECAAPSPPSAVAGSAAAGTPLHDAFRLERDGDLWLCTCGDETFHLGDLKGVRMLARLVAEPGREIHALDLASDGDASGVVDAGDAGEVLDARARREYELRVEALRAEIDEAREWDDLGREERAREELEALGAELARAFGIGGRSRRAANAAERARVNVQRRLKDAVARVSAHHEAAGRHLERALKTGAFCVYDP